MYDWAKQAETLVEVVYPAMDGYIYFLELETGKPTRDSLNLGFTFKGTGTLDPRGYPLLYVGSGYNSYNGTSHLEDGIYFATTTAGSSAAGACTLIVRTATGTTFSLTYSGSADATDGQVNVTIVKLRGTP